MQPFNRNIQLKLRSRPLRLAYLVDSKDDLKNAVTLYTHTWGGAVGAILPTPKDENNIKELKVSLTRVDPDYIFTSDQELPSYIEKFLEKYPAIRYSISEDKICRYIQCKGEIALHTGTLSTGITRASIPHIISVLRHLYPDPSNDTNFYFIEPDSTFELELMLQGGILSQHYRDSLIKHFGAKAFFYHKILHNFLRPAFHLLPQIIQFLLHWRILINKLENGRGEIGLTSQTLYVYFSMIETILV